MGKINAAFRGVGLRVAGAFASLFVLVHCLFNAGGGRFHVEWRKGIAALEPKLLALDGGDACKALDRSFALLGILDDKASGLLSVNALLAGFLTVFIAFYKDPAHSEGAHFVIALASGQLFILMLSALLCFAIIRMNWGFLSRVKVNGGTAKADDELKAVCVVVGERTYLFVFAWWLTMISLFVLLVLAYIYVTS